MRRKYWSIIGTSLEDIKNKNKTNDLGKCVPSDGTCDDVKHTGFCISVCVCLQVDKNSWRH